MYTNSYNVPNSPTNLRYIIEYDGTVYIDMIFTPREQMNQGYGSATLTAFLDEYSPYADITLIASPVCDGINKERLIKWYERHGFVETKRGKFGSEMIYKKRG